MESVAAQVLQARQEARQNLRALATVRDRTVECSQELSLLRALEPFETPEDTRTTIGGVPIFPTTNSPRAVAGFGATPAFPPQQSPPPPYAPQYPQQPPPSYGEPPRRGPRRRPAERDDEDISFREFAGLLGIGTTGVAAILFHAWQYPTFRNQVKAVWSACTNASTFQSERKALQESILRMVPESNPNKPDFAKMILENNVSDFKDKVVPALEKELVDCRTIKSNLKGFYNIVYDMFKIPIPQDESNLSSYWLHLGKTLNEMQGAAAKATILGDVTKTAADKDQELNKLHFQAELQKIQNENVLTLEKRDLQAAKEKVAALEAKLSACESQLRGNATTTSLSSENIKLAGDLRVAQDRFQLITEQQKATIDQLQRDIVDLRATNSQLRTSLEVKDREALATTLQAMQHGLDVKVQSLTTEQARTELTKLNEVNKTLVAQLETAKQDAVASMQKELESLRAQLLQAKQDLNVRVPPPYVPSQHEGQVCQQWIDFATDVQRKLWNEQGQKYWNHWRTFLTHAEALRVLILPFYENASNLPKKMTVLGIIRLAHQVLEKYKEEANCPLPQFRDEDVGWVENDIIGDWEKAEYSN